MEKEKLDKLNDMLRKGTGNSEHIGLSNVKKRLSILYNSTAEMWLENGTDGNMTVQIRF